MAATGCPDRLAAALTLSSWSALAQHDYDAVGKRLRSPRPISLFFVIGEDVSVGKSSASRLAFEAHYEADEAIELRYERVRREQRAGEKARKGKTVTQQDEAATQLVTPAGGASLFHQQFEDDFVIPYPPVALTEDFTQQKLLYRLANGRVSQTAHSAEAASVFQNYALKAGNRMSTLSTLSKFYDGDQVSLERVHMDEDIRLRTGYRFSLCWAAQPDPVRELIFSDEAAYGFASRCFTSICDAVSVVDAPGDVATHFLDEMQSLIRIHRQRQDEGAEFERSLRRNLPILSPTSEALRLLENYQWTTARTKVQMESRQATGYWGRSGEHAFRLAATLHAIRLYQGQQTGHQWSLHDLEQAIEVVNWHGDQIREQSELHTPEVVHATAALAATLRQAVHWNPPGRGRPADGETVPLLSWLSQTHPKGTGLLRRDKDAQSWAFKVLESHGWVYPLGRGRYAVNPWVLRG